MMTLVEFLLTRIEEDDASARASIARERLGLSGNTFAPRVLAECAAKRRIIAALDRGWGNDGDWGVGYSDASWEACQALAAVYNDHPDYDRLASR